MSGKSGASYRKHEIIERLAKGQQARALLFLRPGQHVFIIDMHAGDGRGVDLPQADLFGAGESTPTAALAAGLGATLRHAGLVSDVYLCERNAGRRATLGKMFPDAIVARNHDDLPSFATFGYQWGLVFNDPNGPSGHGDDVLQRIATEVPRADFLININIGAIDRIMRLTGYTTNENAPVYVRDPAQVTALQDRTGWRRHARQWLRLLGRRHVLIPNWTYGSRAMRGSVILVSNAPQRTPKGYMCISEFTEPETVDARRPVHSLPARTGIPDRTSRTG